MLILCPYAAIKLGVFSMKFHFKNLGPIDEASIELAPLTVICGRNNTGKTYVTYAIYAFLAMWRQLIDLEVDEADMDKLFSDGAISIDLESFCTRNWSDVKTKINQKWKHSLPEAFCTSVGSFQKTEVDFELPINFIDSWKAPSFKNEFRSSLGRILLSSEKIANSHIIEIVPLEDEKNKNNFPQSTLKGLIEDTLVEVIFASIFKNTFMASTERTGAIVFKDALNSSITASISMHTLIEGWGQIDKKNFAPSNQYRNRKHPLPVAQNLAFVNEFNYLDKQISPLANKHPNLLVEFQKISGGTYKTDVNGITKFVHQSSNTELYLNEASSSVRSLIHIWYWLKSQADIGHMLMIDEPELNLHPENQRAFARFLVKLVNVGVKVFITTHSDTMIREFNTLMMFHRRLEHMEKVRIRHGYEESEFLAPENIHLYMARSRNVTREKSTLELMIPDVKLGVDADIFDETISTMNNVQDDLRYGVI